MNPKLNGDVNYKSYGSIYTSLMKHEQKDRFVVTGDRWFLASFGSSWWTLNDSA